MILDEPTAGLDPLAAEVLKEKIIKENKEKSLDVLNNKIITEANLNGGGDNITIITSKVLK